MLDPDNEFNVDRTLTKDDVQKLIMVSKMAGKRHKFMFHVQVVYRCLIIHGFMIRGAQKFSPIQK